MYYIDDYKQQAIDKIIPYLIEFPQIVSIIEDSADRYQAIEDVLWQIANNFKVADSRGVFLNAHAHNEVVDLVYTDKAKDAFTYGTEYPDTQAFGTGHFYSQASYLSGIPKDISEAKLIRAVQEKIIQNNTNGTIEDFIEAMKLHFNASKVTVYESYPLAISLMLAGDKLELSSSDNKIAVKKCLPACVSLNNFYINDNLFDQFVYSDKSEYANDSRYPITLGNSDYMYKYISTAINLNSTDEEYFKIINPFFNISYEEYTPVECITGKLTALNNNATIYSFNFQQGYRVYKVSLKIKLISGEYYFALVKSEWDEDNSIWVDDLPVNTNIKPAIDKDYTLLMSINRDTFDYFRLWIFDGVKLSGQNSSQDMSWAYNIAQNNNNFTQIQLERNDYNRSSYINSDIATVGNGVFAMRTDGRIPLPESGNPGNWGPIVFNNDSYIALSENGYISTCTSGSIWSTPVQVLPYIGTSEPQWYLLVVFGDKLLAFSKRGYVASSEDNGLSWIIFSVAFPTSQQDVINDIICVKVNGVDTLFAISARGSTRTSINGVNWARHEGLGNHGWSALCYNGAKFVALGLGGNIATSTDGMSWTASVKPDLRGFRWCGVIYDGSSFIALSENNGYLITSIDGTSWSTPDNYTNNGYFSDIIYVNGRLSILKQQGELYSYTVNANTFDAFGDFTYYAVMGGRINTENGIDMSNNPHYYVTCFGEKNILFNCLENKNHVLINTNSTLEKDLTVKQSSFNYKKWHSNSKFLNIRGLSGQPSIQWSKDTDIDALINSFELSFDICLPFLNYGDIINGIIGSDSNLKISYNPSSLEITIPTYTSGNVEVPYTLTIFPFPTLTDKFKNIKLVYNDNTLYVYADNVLKSTQNILNVNLRYLSTILELGPINAFVRNLKFNCVYTDGININTLEYDLPLTSSLYETNNLLQPSNTNARFLTIPQPIDNTTNQDLFGNETLRKLN